MIFPSQHGQKISATKPQKKTVMNLSRRWKVLRDPQDHHPHQDGDSKGSLKYAWIGCGIGPRAGANQHGSRRDASEVP
jgi:hypothetical protein